MLQRLQGLRVHKVFRQLPVAELLAPHADGIIDHLFLGPRTVLLQHLAGIGISKHRLNPRRHVARVEGNRARRRNRRQQRVADAVFANGRPHIVVHLLHRARRQKRIGIEERERAFLLRQIDRRQIRGAGDRVQPALRLTRRRVRSIAQPQHQQRIRQPCDTQSNPSLRLRLRCLRVEREVRRVDHIVHHPHRGSDEIRQRRLIQRGGILERLRHQPCKVDRPQQTRAVRRQRLFPTRVRRSNRFAIVQVVRRVDPVDEDHAGLGIVIGRLHDPVPQVLCLHRPVDLAVKYQIPRRVGLYGLHEIVCHQHRQVEHPQARRVGFCANKVLDIRVIAAHRGHHRAAARAG